jgi:hypothetical protein
MNARNKLNIAYLNGSLIVAAVLGLILHSWPIFVIALVVLVIANVLSGGIRPSGRNR